MTSSVFTKTQAALVDAIKVGVAAGVWEMVPGRGNTVRYAERGIPTPDGIPVDWWPGSDYDRYLFLTVISGRPWRILYRLFRFPWVEAIDTSITFKRAFEVVADPAAQFDGGCR